MTRVLKDRIAELDRQGFTLVGIRASRHTKLDVLTPSGKPMTITISTTPSDWRIGKKFRAQLRRFVRPASVTRINAGV